jgi:hypothetical protein
MKPTSICCNQHTTSEDLLWSTADVANYLRCSERQVFNLRQLGLPAVQVGGLIRFIPSRVREWLDGRDLGHDASDERSSQLADVTATGDDDNSECATADSFREFPSAP